MDMRPIEHCNNDRQRSLPFLRDYSHEAHSLIMPATNLSSFVENLGIIERVSSCMWLCLPFVCVCILKPFSSIRGSKMQLCIELLAIYCRCFALVQCTQMYDAWWMHSLSTLERSEQHVNSFETSQLFLSWSRWARVRHHRVVEFWSWVHPYWRFDWKVSPLKRGGVLIGRNLGVLSC